MRLFQERVVRECAELEQKIDKLAAFFQTDTFKVLHKEERERLIEQHGHMCKYRDVLRARIQAFT